MAKCLNGEVSRAESTRCGFSRGCCGGASVCEREVCERWGNSGGVGGEGGGGRVAATQDRWLDGNWLNGGQSRGESGIGICLECVL